MLSAIALRTLAVCTVGSLHTTTLVCLLALFITSSPASVSRFASATRGVTVEPLITTFMPWTRPSSPSRPGFFHWHATRGTEAGYTDLRLRQLTTGSGNCRLSAIAALRRKISDRTRASS